MGYDSFMLRCAAELKEASSMKVLMVLLAKASKDGEVKGLKMKEIEAITGIKKNNLSGLLKRLENSGYIEIIKTQTQGRAHEYKILN